MALTTVGIWGGPFPPAVFGGEECEPHPRTPRHTLVKELKCTLKFLRVCFLEGNRTCNQRGAAFLYRHVFAIRTVVEMDPQIFDC